MRQVLLVAAQVGDGDLGVIAAVVETHELGDVSHRIDAMLVPDLVEINPNEVAFFVVDGAEGARVLHPLPVE